MKPSLSVVVPFHNVQATLTGTVEELLEIVPELTPQFEVLLVDDGSTDASREAANELSLGYPQVQVVAQSRRLGPQECLRSTLRFTHGEFVLSCTDRPEFDLHEMQKLWDRKTNGGAVWGRCPARGALGSIPQPPQGTKSAAESSPPDLLLVPRRLLASWQSPGRSGDAVAYLRERGYDVQGLALRRRSFGGGARLQAALSPHFVAPALGIGARGFVQTGVDRVSPPMPRPNLLHSKFRAAAPNQ